MKKFILTTPLAIMFSVFSFNANLEAAGCNSHKNKNANLECSLSDDNCDKNKLEKKYNKVDA